MPCNNCQGNAIRHAGSYWTSSISCLYWRPNLIRLSISYLWPSELAEVVEDYQSTGLSLRTHPVQLLKQQGLLGKFVQAAELTALNHKSVVTVIGLVTARQSPGTASGVTFITLEDGTGFSNLVVWSATASAQRQAYLKSKLLKVNGILEKKDGVIHIIAGRLTDLTPLLGSLDLTPENSIRFINTKEYRRCGHQKVIKETDPTE